MRPLGIEVRDGDRPLGPCDVTLDGERFGGIEPARAPAVGGLSVVPGLIDRHVHLVGNADAQAADFYTWSLATPREEQALHGELPAQLAG